MANRRDSASARLKKFIERARNPLASEQTVIGMAREFGMIPEASRARVDWNDPAQHARGAHEALRPDLDELEEPIRKAFDAFGYDLNNPFDWRMLLLAFAFAHFPPSKKGAPKKWDDVRWCQLLSDFGKEKTSRPNASENEVCINIKKRFARRYATVTAATLRKNLQYARDPSRNHTLAQIRAQFANRMRDWFIARTGGSSPPNPDALSQMALELARQFLESALEPNAAKE
jgi:hypothetical protein